MPPTRDTREDAPPPRGAEPAAIGHNGTTWPATAPLSGVPQHHLMPKRPPWRGQQRRVPHPKGTAPQ